VNNSDWAIRVRMIKFLFLSILIAIISLLISPLLYSPVLHIKSASYFAPNGCVVKHYITMEDISSSCMKSGYIVPRDSARSYNWDLGRNHLDYYRVGDDAYQIECGEFNPNGCKVNLTVRNAFSR